MTASITRRGALQGAVAVAGAGLLAACSTEKTPAEAAGATDTAAEPAPLAILADLPWGTAVPVESSEGKPVLLVRTSATAVSAYSALCPHSGCTVPGGSGTLVCPCHGSGFTVDGELVNGPARRGLAVFEVAVVDGAVLPA